MVKGLFILLLAAFTNVSFCQDSTFRFLKTYTIPVTEAAIDKLDNLYLITATDQLKKLNAAGDSLAVYNNVKKYGKLHAMDVANPLKTLLFYKDFSFIVVLDRLLSLRTEIDLRRINILQASAVGLSYDNNIWVFDEYNNRLKKIDEFGNTLIETSDFRQLFDQTILPKQIIDQNGLLYLYDDKNGVLIFDNYGTFKRKLPITGWASIAVNNETVFGIYQNALYTYHQTNFSQKQYPFPGNFLPYQLSISNHKLIALQKDSLHIYSYK